MPLNVYSGLLDEILRGELPPGAPLGELATAARFGRSRTPVRQALQRLVTEGLAERGPRGVVVRATSPEEILDIYEVRTTLEGAAARGAANRHTDLDMAVMRTAQRTMRDLDTDEGRLRADVNRAFHQAVWAASHSPTLVDLLGRLNTHLIRYPTTTLTFGSRWEEVLREHDEILRAISDGDAQRAEHLAVAHMTGARDVRLQMYAERRPPRHPGP